MCVAVLPIVVAALHARRSESEATAAASKRAQERERGTRTEGQNDWWQISQQILEAVEAMASDSVFERGHRRCGQRLLLQRLSEAAEWLASVLDHRRTDWDVKQRATAH